ncbi:MAG: dihydroneopterin aldolase [Succinivibrio sp.]
MTRLQDGRLFMDKVFINGLTLNCIIGILPYEREHEQLLVLDVAMGCDTAAAAKSGDVAKTINYAAVAEFITNYCTDRKAGLLEELGDELCRKIISEFGASYVALRMTKPEAVHGATGGAGIEIARGRVPQGQSLFARMQL